MYPPHSPIFPYATTQPLDPSNPFIPSARVSPPPTPAIVTPAPSHLNFLDNPRSELQRDMAAQAGMLASCSLDIEALTRAEGLCDVIAQVESGQVQAIREKYGPQRRRPTHLMWGKIKVAITRRERLYTLFKEQFQGDKDRFFAFFKKQQKSNEGHAFMAFRAVVEAIPHMERDLAAEKEKPEYFAFNSFSDAIWDNKWKLQNKMEIWRAIGKESYGRCKA